MKTNKTQSELVAYYIADNDASDSIDTCSDSDRILFNKSFFEMNKLKGSFFSCIYDSKLRIHLVFNEDTTAFNLEIVKLIQDSMNISGITRGVIWFRRTTKNIISLVEGSYSLTPNPEEFYYYSTEYSISRDKFSKTFDNGILEVRLYEEKHIDEYLELLNDSMSFFIPPEDFVSNKEQYLQEFADYKGKNAFEAFWKNGELVGLYWIDGIEVDTMGVISNQHKVPYNDVNPPLPS